MSPVSSFSLPLRFPLFVIFIRKNLSKTSSHVPFFGRSLRVKTIFLLRFLTERERVRDVSKSGEITLARSSHTRDGKRQSVLCNLFCDDERAREREREREAPRIINSSSSSSGKRGYLACYHKEHKKKTDLDDDDDDVSTTASVLCCCYFFFFFFIRRRRRWIVVVPTTPSTRSRGVDDDEQNWNRCW